MFKIIYNNSLRPQVHKSSLIEEDQTIGVPSDPADRVGLYCCGKFLRMDARSMGYVDGFQEKKKAIVAVMYI